MKLFKSLLFACIMLGPLAAMADGPNGPGMMVVNGFSGFAWYQGTGSGMVHERWGCDTNFENCGGNWQWFPTYKWPEGPDECDGDGPFGPALLGDVGEGSDILEPDEYYYCVKSKIFRDKS
jgi:hypothetical protein